MAVRAHVGERRRARAAVQVLVGAPDGDVDAGSGHVDLHRAGGVAEVPHDHGAVLGGAGGLGGEVDPRPGAEVDERTQGHVDARQIVAPAAHRRSRRRGDAGHHVAVGGEVARIDGDHRGPVVGDGTQGGVHRLVEVHRRRVVDDHRARGRPDDGRQAVADPCGQVDPVLPRGDEGAGPLLVEQGVEPGAAWRAAPCRASCRRGR